KKMDGMETQYQLQLMQQDVLELRGMVEQLQHQLKQIQSTQEDRYLELDSRFQALSSQLQGGASVMPAKDAGTNAQAGSGEIADVTKEEKIDSKSRTEKTLYETALELIRRRQYELAIGQLQAVIDQYPQGDFTANAYYWLGEVYAAKPNPEYEKARQALAQVITFFPDNRKVPDAAFKLGKVYHLMGDCQSKKKKLEQVARDYKGTSVGKLAEAYLRDKIDC
ncbi:MAG: tetratricopeptide repeat protein, partial [Pseudomonadales bacterium]|nr:tetratricopeptide repeat protein [Pseudomonadales bacterium]